MRPPITNYETYKIIRFYHPRRKESSKIVQRGLTLKEAQAHCNDKTTSTPEYFDGYEKEE